MWAAQPRWDTLQPASRTNSISRSVRLAIAPAALRFLAQEPRDLAEVREALDCVTVRSIELRTSSVGYESRSRKRPARSPWI
jgi:hypothetical protein